MKHTFVCKTNCIRSSTAHHSAESTTDSRSEKGMPLSAASSQHCVPHCPEDVAFCWRLQFCGTSNKKTGPFKSGEGDPSNSNIFFKAKLQTKNHIFMPFSTEMLVHKSHVVHKCWLFTKAQCDALSLLSRPKSHSLPCLQWRWRCDTALVANLGCDCMIRGCCDVRLSGTCLHLLFYIFKAVAFDCFFLSLLLLLEAFFEKPQWRHKPRSHALPIY